MTGIKMVEDPERKEHEPARAELCQTQEEPAERHYQIPGWLQTVEKGLVGFGMLVGMILALPFIAISFGIEYFKGKINEHRNE